MSKKELTEEQKMKNINMVLDELRKMTENQLRLNQPKPDTFKEALIEAINIYSQENGSDTPDYILAEYLVDCLAKFNKAVNDREVYYGRLKNGVPTN